MKIVSNLIENIGKCRDILETKDKKLIISKLGLFRKVCNDVQVHLYKFCKNNKHTMDFNSSDLSELSEEIADYIQQFPSRFRYRSNYKEITKNPEINDKVLHEFIDSKTKEMCIDTNLREAQKLLSYYALILWVYEQNANNEDFMNQLAVTLKGLL